MDNKNNRTTFRTSRLFSKKKFIGRYQDLVDKYSVSTSQIIHDCLGVYILRTNVVYHLNNVFYCFSFVFVLLLILLLLLYCFTCMWYPFNETRNLNIPSMCLYCPSFFAGVFCICDFLYFFGSYNVTLL